MYKRPATSLITALCCLYLVYAPPTQAEESQQVLNTCILDAMTTASDNTTIGFLKKQCQKHLAKLGAASNLSSTAISKQAQASSKQTDTSTSPVVKRIIAEKNSEDASFIITPYKPNYLLLGAYNFAEVHHAPFREMYNDDSIELDKIEAKFQLSFKFPVVKNLFGNNGDLYAAYTNRSFWQVYNKTLSSPFRETNHEPEAWLRFYTGWKIFGLNNAFNDIGINHQSNGRGGNLSRSWNRIYLRSVFAKGNLGFAIQPWYRLPETEEKDDNPDIHQYMGHFELTSVYKWQQHQFSLMLRNNLRSKNNHGATQLDWSFPVYGRLRGYVQWFNGYGESLIDYNRRVNSIGLGIKLTDWL
ncbi:phospholipase A [Candidatus Venteria ishoeyi]|uniref:phospholipase A n=1 Tax=Candidatus Venteria ishoeyi TaxID=1899563 RepID=UPI0025A59727|nr:phospholipase A [Candidatus Venteria ishoeyi]MDM8546534.1 phospholipase A [Candidatus Venteria ishoeyi]